MIIPSIINIQKIDSNIGNLSILEFQKHINFEIKRIFILNQIHSEVLRGNHAHKETEQFLICLQGEINFFAELPNGESFNYLLNDCNQGIYIPANSWHYMKYQKDTIQLVCASKIYDENDYLRTKEEYHNFYKIS